MPPDPTPTTPPTTVDPFGPMKEQLGEMASEAFDQYGWMLVGIGAAVIVLPIVMHALRFFFWYFHVLGHVPGSMGAAYRHWRS